MSVLITRKFADGGFGTRDERAQCDCIEYEVLKAGEHLSVTITDQEIGGGWYRLWLDGDDAADAARAALATASSNGVVNGFSIINTNE